VLKHFANGDPARLASLSLRFAAPILPGQDITFELWKSNERIDFRASVAGRTVLDQGVATLRL